MPIVRRLLTAVALGAVQSLPAAPADLDAAFTRFGAGKYPNAAAKAAE